MPTAIGAVRIAQLALENSTESELNRPVVEPVTVENEHLDVVADEVEELAHMASDLSKTVAQKHIEQVLEHEHEDQGST